MKPPIHEVVRRIQRLPLAHQVAHIKALVDFEPERSIRRQELLSLLSDLQLRRLKHEKKLKH